MTIEEYREQFKQIAAELRFDPRFIAAIRDAAEKIVELTAAIESEEVVELVVDIGRVEVFEARAL